MTSDYVILDMSLKTKNKEEWNDDDVNSLEGNQAEQRQ